ncbi:glycosyl hydrolase [Niabella terrae]
MAQSRNTNLNPEVVFANPPDAAKPWVLWYWMHGAVSREGITADLEGLHKNGIGGVYLACIYDTVASIPFANPARQLSSQWWAMIHHAMKECRRLDMKMSLHMSDGFALAGGPWIRPEQSMQKLVWTRTLVAAGGTLPIHLAQPETNEGYYKDVAVFAFPAGSGEEFGAPIPRPVVTASNGSAAGFLAAPGEDKETFRADSSCWIQYQYPQPFTLRSLKIHSGNYQSRRLILLAGNDGNRFDTVMRLVPPRHGWQDTDEDYSFSVPETRARFFRLVYEKAGTEAGSEDLDAAKWKPSLKVKGIWLSERPVINQIEAKNGSVWRVAAWTSEHMVPDSLAVPLSAIINLSDRMNDQGELNWNAPAGDWVVVRIGHTSTGHTNATGGAAKGLECDKFDAAAIQLHFDNWFGKVFENTDSALVHEVLKTFYIDSWEAGSQNWNRNFAAEFKKRRGYDLMPYLLVMTGTPIDNVGKSEQILHDVRTTIAELVNDVFYVTLRKLSAAKGCDFMAENVAPTMVSDGLLHFKTVDYPTGEFWLNSPTHDKPNDIFDAVSGGHIYGKNRIQAEAYTNLRMAWTENPGNIKIVGDRNFAAGINKMILHVTTHNPWLDRKPGMTLGSIGLFYQRDQTWFSQSKGWIDYMARSSAMLQLGRPVTDIAVFTGEEIPRRSILPDRLVSSLPGLFGKERLLQETKRLANAGQPQRTVPVGVTHSANMADPEDWTNGLRGYKYDCFNPDVLKDARVVNGRVVFASGASYALLVFPGQLLMQPENTRMSLPVARKVLELARAGAHILIDTTEKQPIGFHQSEAALRDIWKQLLSGGHKSLVPLPYWSGDFSAMGLERDLDAGSSGNAIAWTHRSTAAADIYFISNQRALPQHFELSFRVSGRMPEIWDPVTGRQIDARNWQQRGGRTFMSLKLDGAAAVFVVFRRKARTRSVHQPPLKEKQLLAINTNWKVQFDTAMGGPRTTQSFSTLNLWNKHHLDAIRYYSGTAVYRNNFTLPVVNRKRTYYLDIDHIYDIASVRINGRDCGTLWTRPYRLDISAALKTGKNTIEIRVTNTWANRLIGDLQLPERQRISWTTAPLNFLEGQPLAPAGLQGPIRLIMQR